MSVKLFVGEYTRHIAHHLDDLYERWRLKLETITPESELRIPEMPELESYQVAVAFRTRLFEKRREIESQLGKLKIAVPHSERRLNYDYHASRRHLLNGLRQIEDMQRILNQYIAGAKGILSQEFIWQSLRLFNNGLLNVYWSKEKSAVALEIGGIVVRYFTKDELDSEKDSVAS